MPLTGSIRIVCFPFGGQISDSHEIAAIFHNVSDMTAFFTLALGEEDIRLLHRLPCAATATSEFLVNYRVSVFCQDPLGTLRHFGKRIVIALIVHCYFLSFPLLRGILAFGASIITEKSLVVKCYYYNLESYPQLFCVNKPPKAA